MEATIKFSKYVLFHFISLIFVLWTVIIMKFSSHQWKDKYYLIIKTKKSYERILFKSTQIIWAQNWHLLWGKWLCYILGWFEKHTLLIGLLLYTHTKRRHILAHLQTCENNWAKICCLGRSNGQISKQDHLKMNVAPCSAIHLKSIDHIGR